MTPASVLDRFLAERRLSQQERQQFDLMHRTLLAALQAEKGDGTYEDIPLAQLLELLLFLEEHYPRRVREAHQEWCQFVDTIEEYALALQVATVATSLDPNEVEEEIRSYARQEPKPIFDPVPE